MKIVHLTDLHIAAGAVMNTDPVEPCLAALHHIAQYHQDADRIIVTGDLTDHGDEASYRTLASLLNDAGYYQDERVRLLLGNHDDRENFLRVFPESPRDEQGFIQYRDDTPAGRFLYLDTLQAGTGLGHLSNGRLEWLESELCAASEEQTPVWLFMHHNPLHVFVRSADSIGLADKAPFQALVKQHRSLIRHIAFGHCHFTLSGSLHGIGLSANRGTARGLWPSIGQKRARFATGPQERHYSVMLVEAEATVVHTVDFLSQQHVHFL